MALANPEKYNIQNLEFYAYPHSVLKNCIQAKPSTRCCIPMEKSSAMQRGQRTDARCITLAYQVLECRRASLVAGGPGSILRVHREATFSSCWAGKTTKKLDTPKIPRGIKHHGQIFTDPLHETLLQTFRWNYKQGLHFCQG